MKFIDFFSGIGGFRIGMEQAGHTCVGHCEIDKFADASYRSMHTITEEQRKYLLTLSKKQRVKEIRKEEYLNGEWYADDIGRVLPGNLPEADCYCFGFPCQSFSISGHRRGFEDARGTLFFEVMRLAKERKPKVLFAENVAGLLSHDGGGAFATIINTMGELGYLVEWQMLNSKYFGIPQNRERLFLVGHLNGQCRRTVFPIGVSDNETSGIQRFESCGVIANTLTARITADTNGTYPIFTKDNPAVVGFIKVNGRHHRKEGEQLPIDPKTIKARRLTPNECFRLQGFSDEYFKKAEQINSNSALYKQAGNSVTVNVIYEIAKRLEQ